MNVHQKTLIRDTVNVVDVEGSALECGEQLGSEWGEELRALADAPAQGTLPLLDNREIMALFERYAPAFPDIFRGMAAGAGIKENQVRSVFSGSPKEGCTSFAVAPGATAAGRPISGQTKDTGASRIAEYEVLRLKVSGGLQMLTLTYPGWLFGHGFIVGGCSVFRNSLYAGDASGLLPYDIWGLLVSACDTIEDVKRITSDYGTIEAAHCAVADTHGGIIGIEMTCKGYAFLPPCDDIYVHTNHCSSKAFINLPNETDGFGYAASVFREKRLRELLSSQNGSITAQNAFAALCDHENHPDSICSDQRKHDGVTSAAVVVEPVDGRMHVVCGLPCQGTVQTYEI